MRFLILLVFLFGLSATLDQSFAAKANSNASCAKYFKGTKEEMPLDLKAKLKGLNYDYAYTASLDELDRILYDYHQPKLPKFQKRKKKTDTLAVSDLRFMQKSAKFKSSSRKGGYEVLANARALRDGDLTLDELPPLRVWQDSEGRIWSQDHRRLAAIILAGNIEEVSVVWSTEDEVKGDWDKYEPIDDGLSMDIVNERERARGGQWAIRISIP